MTLLSPVSFCCRADGFESYPVKKPKDRFSNDDPAEEIRCVFDDNSKIIFVKSS